MFKSVIFGAPMKCPNRTCRADFWQDCHLGWLPKSELEVYAIMKCTICRDRFMVAQMVNMVHDYKASLPMRDLPKNQITIFNTKDQEAFRKELYQDDNPLFNLYDGYYPGATDNFSEDS